MKQWIKTSSLLLAFCLMTIATQAQKFGYVNSGAILAELPQVKEADANLEALSKQLTKKGQQMVAELQTKFQAVQKQVEAGELSPAQQQAEGTKLQAEEQKIAKFDQDMQKQIMEKRESLLKPILDRVNQAIQDVAKENGYQFIFDAQVLLYAEDSQDVSDLVKSKLGI